MSATPHTIADTTHDGYATVTLRSPDGLAAAFAPGEGMVGCSLTHKGDELLGQRGGLATYADHGSTFGIPLLHPWANRLPGWTYTAAGHTVVLDHESALIHCDEHDLPIHGVLAAAPDWEVTERHADEHRARLQARLNFGAQPARLAAFPFPHDIELTVELRGTTLTITTTIRAHADGPVPISFGWHPYFALPGAPRALWELAAPVHQRLILDAQMIPTGEREPITIAGSALGATTYDDGYLAPTAPFVLEAGGRRITVAFGEHYPFAQVYAPADLDVVCLEPMTAPTAALASGEDLPIIPAGGEFAATFSIEVAPASPPPSAREFSPRAAGS